jgi:putative membrane protein
MALVGLGLLGVIGALILLRILGVGWYLLRFYGHRLTQLGDDLQISCGLLTRVSATVPRKRIQVISVQQSLLLKWMGLTTVRIETAGGTDGQEDASQSVSRRWFLPVLPDSDLPRILNSLRPGTRWETDNTQWTTVARRAFRRSVRMLAAISLVLGCVGGYFLPPWGWVIGVVLLILLGGVTYLDLKSIRYARLDQGIVFKSGFFLRKTSYTFFGNVQTLKTKQSIFDRRWKMASLTIDTVGAGPAEHPLILSKMDQDFVFAEFKLLNQVAARQLPDYAKRSFYNRRRSEQ